MGPHLFLHRLPNFTISTTMKDDEDDDYMTIWLDWPIHSKYFSVHNLKSFESLLSVYPDAHFKILLRLPNEQNTDSSMNPYKKADNYHLSSSHFIKYQRSTYDIEIVRVGKMEKGHTSHIARKYWSKWVTVCCTSTSKYVTNDENVQNQDLPYHVLTFIRLSKIWRKGGIFSDFSFFFLGPLDRPLITQVKERNIIILFLPFICLFFLFICLLILQCW